MTEVNGVKWRMGVPELIIIITLIVALATTLTMKASSTSVASLAGRISVVEGQYGAIVDNQSEIKLMLKAIDDRQRDTNERLARIESVHGIKK